MVHVRFDTNTVAYNDFIQTGEGIENVAATGNEGNHLNYFNGFPPYQRGYGLQAGNGISDILRGVYRFFLPLISRAGKSVASEALNTGQRVIEKINEGQPLKTTLLDESKRGVDKILEKSSLPKQFGTGRKNIKRKTKNKKSIIPKHQTIIGRAVTKPIINPKKRLRSDAFGLY